MAWQEHNREWEHHKWKHQVENESEPAALASRPRQRLGRVAKHTHNQQLLCTHNSSPQRTRILQFDRCLPADQGLNLLSVSVSVHSCRAWESLYSYHSGQYRVIYLHTLQEDIKAPGKRIKAQFFTYNISVTQWCSYTRDHTGHSLVNSWVPK